MEDEEELENGDDEEIQARKKLLKLLEQGDNVGRVKFFRHSLS